MGDDELIIDVQNCKRCGMDHVALKFRNFHGNPMITQEGEWNYWTMCPSQNDPILIRVKQETPSMEVAVKAFPLMRGSVTMNVRIEDAGQMALRRQLAIWLMRVAGKILNCNIDIETSFTQK